MNLNFTWEASNVSNYLFSKEIAELFNPQSDQSRFEECKSNDSIISKWDYCKGMLETIRKDNKDKPVLTHLSIILMSCKFEFLSDQVKGNNIYILMTYCQFSKGEVHIR